MRVVTPDRKPIRWLSSSGGRKDATSGELAGLNPLPFPPTYLYLTLMKRYIAERCWIISANPILRFLFIAIILGAGTTYEHGALGKSRSGRFEPKEVAVRGPVTLRG